MLKNFRVKSKFFLRLLAKNLPRILSLRPKRIHKGLLKTVGSFKYKPGWKDVIIALLLGLLLSSHHIIYGLQPPTKVPPLAKKLPETHIQPVAEVQPKDVPMATPVAVAPVVIPVTTSGCVTGYTTGDYAENALMQRESSGNSCAENAGGCFGLLQACPGAPLKAACGGDPVCQLDWFTRIKLPTYGTWENAWAQDEARYPHWW